MCVTCDRFFATYLRSILSYTDSLKELRESIGSPSYPARKRTTGLLWRVHCRAKLALADHNAKFHQRLPLAAGHRCRRISQHRA